MQYLWSNGRPIQCDHATWRSRGLSTETLTNARKVAKNRAKDDDRRDTTQVNHA